MTIKSITRIHLSPPHMSGEEMNYIKYAFEQNWIAPLGPNVDAFEESLGHYCGVKDVAALNSGTAAIHLALILLGVKREDRVLAPTFTFSATVNPIIYQGATPVFIDSEPDTWNMNPDLMEQAIKDGRKKGKNSRIKAIIVVHLYGMPAKMDEIMMIANKYNIPVIEDAAEALGSTYNGVRTGTIGKLGILSFNGNKIITTSCGGALISDDEKLISSARFLASQARDKAVHYQHSELGYNYRMSNILAGVGLGQLKAIEERIYKRRAINKWYRELLQEVPGITFHTAPSNTFYSNYWLTCITVDSRKSGISNMKLRQALEEANIESRPLWKPMHMQPVFAAYQVYDIKIADELFKNGLCLPSGSNMSDLELERISNVLRKKLKR